MAVAPAGREVQGTPVFRSKRYQVATRLSPICFALCETEQDGQAIQLQPETPRSGALRIAKAATGATVRLIVTLPSGMSPDQGDMTLQYRYEQVDGQRPVWASLLLALGNGELQSLPATDAKHEVIFRGVVAGTKQYRRVQSGPAPGWGSVVFAIELEAAESCFDLIDISILVGESTIFLRGADLLAQPASSSALEHAQTGAEEEVCRLIRLCEAQTDAWERMARSYLGEIDVLRRELDDAHVRIAALTK